MTATTALEEPTTITLSTKRYKELLDSENFLACLEACGVDNWSGGYEDACRMHREGEEATEAV